MANTKQMSEGQKFRIVILELPGNKSKTITVWPDKATTLEEMSEKVSKATR